MNGRSVRVRACAAFVVCGLLLCSAKAVQTDDRSLEVCVVTASGADFWLFDPIGRVASVQDEQTATEIPGCEFSQADDPGDTEADSTYEPQTGMTFRISHPTQGRWRLKALVPQVSHVVGSFVQVQLVDVATDSLSQGGEAIFRVVREDSMQWVFNVAPKGRSNRIVVKAIPFSSPRGSASEVRKRTK